jgi:hypothetical protein
MKSSSIKSQKTQHCQYLEKERGKKEVDMFSRAYISISTEVNTK